MLGRSINVSTFLPQQLLREMQQMASRPFASINVALETDEEPPDLIGGSIKVRGLPVRAPRGVGLVWSRVLTECCLAMMGGREG